MAVEGRVALHQIKGILPRHLEIIYEINRRLLLEVASHAAGNPDLQSRLSLIEEGEVKQVLTSEQLHALYRAPIERLVDATTGASAFLPG